MNLFIRANVGQPAQNKKLDALDILQGGASVTVGPKIWNSDVLVLHTTNRELTSRLPLSFLLTLAAIANAVKQSIFNLTDVSGILLLAL